MVNSQSSQTSSSNSHHLGGLLTILFGITMAVLSGVITNVALPTISSDLGASPAESIWIINSYQIAIIIVLLPLSFLGEMFGYKRVYQIGLAIFIVMSVFCSLASTVDTLTYARVLLGFGAAALMSVNTTLIRLIYSKEKLGRGLGINALVVALASASGPTIGAVILELGSWHWLFLINIPFGLAALILSLRYLPDNPSKNSQQRFDAWSALLNAITFGSFLFALMSVAQSYSLWLTLVSFSIAIVFGAIFVRRQLSLVVPILPIDLLRIPIFSLSLMTSICSFSAQMLAFVSLPFFLQHSLGKTPLETGFLLTPWPLAIMIAAPISGRLLERFHAGLLGGIGMAVMALGLFSFMMISGEPDTWSIVWRMFVCGVGFGLFQSPNNHTILSSAPAQRSGGASGMLATARLLGQSTGTALVALSFTVFTYGTLASLIMGGIFASVAAVVSSLRMFHAKP